MQKCLFLLHGGCLFFPLAPFSQVLATPLVLVCTAALDLSMYTRPLHCIPSHCTIYQAPPLLLLFSLCISLSFVHTELYDSLYIFIVLYNIEYYNCINIIEMMIVVQVQASLVHWLAGATGYHYAAFYADCWHELREVTRGYRRCLVYNLIHRGPLFDTQRCSIRASPSVASRQSIRTMFTIHATQHDASTCVYC